MNPSVTSQWLVEAQELLYEDSPQETLLNLNLKSKAIVSPRKCYLQQSAKRTFRASWPSCNGQWRRRRTRDSSSSLKIMALLAIDGDRSLPYHGFLHGLQRHGCFKSHTNWFSKAHRQDAELSLSGDQVNNSCENSIHP